IQTSLFQSSISTNSTHAYFEIKFHILREEFGWFALGIGTRMSNSQMMIMWPCSRNCTSRGKWERSYRRASGHVLPTPIRLYEAKDTQIQIQENSLPGSLLSISYFRPLNISDLDRLQRAPDQKIIWAMSSSPVNSFQQSLGLQFHDRGFGAVVIDLSLPAEVGYAGYEHKHLKAHDILITLHATFLSIAWVLCAPGAVIAARFSRNHGSSHWVQMHWMLQALNILLTLIGIAFASIAVGMASHIDTIQKRLGFFVLMCLFGQGIEGYYIHCSARNSRTRRPIQNWLHIIFGCALIIIAWFTIAFGIKEWEFLGRGTPLIVSVLMGFSCGLVIFLYLVLVFHSKNKNLGMNKKSSEDPAKKEESLATIRAISPVEKINKSCNG
ncbi:hypothetical protein BY996DRAFT_8428321, partial [Phakopsora pachyrhizi]